MELQRNENSKRMQAWRMAVVVIIGLTAFSKFIAILEPSRLVSQEDQFFRVPILFVIGGACLAEFFLCVYILITPNNSKVAWAVFAFATSVLTYRAITLADGLSYCPCLGNVTDWWPWLGHHEVPILTSIAIWLFLTSAIQLIPRRHAT